MVRPEELQHMGEKIARDFLDRGQSLQTSLEKVAETHRLNAHQLHRVAEKANLDTHLGLLKNASADDAYITFELATAAKIKPIAKVAKLTSNDYQLPPDTNLFTISTEDLVEKTASVAKPKEVNANTAYIGSSVKVAEARKAHSNLSQHEWRLQDKVSEIYSVVKQAALSGTTSNELSYTIKEAAVTCDLILDALEENLSKDKISLTKQASDLTELTGKRVNPDNKLVKLCNDFDKIAASACENFLTFIEKTRELDSSNPLEKRAFDGSATWVGRQLINTIKFPFKYPKTALGVGAFGTGTMYMKNTNAQAKEFAEIAKKYQNIRK